jgi:hypothetical protein
MRFTCPPTEKTRSYQFTPTLHDGDGGRRHRQQGQKEGGGATLEGGTVSERSQRVASACLMARVRWHVVGWPAARWPTVCCPAVLRPAGFCPALCWATICWPVVCCPSRLLACSAMACLCADLQTGGKQFYGLLSGGLQCACLLSAGMQCAGPSVWRPAVCRIAVCWPTYKRSPRPRCLQVALGSASDSLGGLASNTKKRPRPLPVLATDDSAPG